MPGIKYFNTIAQVILTSQISILIAISYVHVVPHVFHGGSVLLVFDGKQTPSVCSAPDLSISTMTRHGNRSKWKYKLTAIMLGVLMLYMMFCSVKCAAQAASQGGSANQVMLFSVVVTYGCKHAKSSQGS